MSDSKSSPSCCERSNYGFVSSSDASWVMCLRNTDGKICNHWRKKLKKSGNLDHISYFAYDMLQQSENALKLIKFNIKFQKNLTL